MGLEHDRQEYIRWGFAALELRGILDQMDLRNALSSVALG